VCTLANSLIDLLFAAVQLADVHGWRVLACTASAGMLLPRLPGPPLLAFRTRPGTAKFQLEDETRPGTAKFQLEDETGKLVIDTDVPYAAVSVWPQC
jgi:hypothetical protein